ncbi:MAG TPA: hypothetical protein VK633_02535 [Verrucomicrobiae bacterium]|nr:hypothetical protein [Verrucomicrobiae bacterium]
MNSFYEQFLTETPGELGAEDGKAVFVGIFGKHPGWNDHIEENQEVPDIGLRTNSLVWAKSILYTQGIGRNIESGAWEKLTPDQGLETFNHNFLWQRQDSYIAGTLWSSSDGKGRKLYPMVVAAHAVGVPLHWVLSVLASRLAALKSDCQQAQLAGEVGAALTRARGDLQNALHWPNRSVPNSREFLSRFARHPQFGPEREGLLRVFGRLKTQAGPFAPGKFSSRNKPRGLGVRVPAAAPNCEEIFCAWSEALRAFIDEDAPLLMLWPIGQNWLDLIIGEPEPEDFFCLRALPSRFAAASEIPVHLDEAKRAETRACLDGLLRGELPAQGSKLSRWFGALFRA